jgi:hypothetical protein
MDASHPVSTEDALTTARDNFGHSGTCVPAAMDNCLAAAVSFALRKFKQHSEPTSTEVRSTAPKRGECLSQESL